MMDLSDNSLKHLPSVGHGSLTREAKALWKSLWMRASAKCFKCKSKRLPHAFCLLSLFSSLTVSGHSFNEQKGLYSSHRQMCVCVSEQCRIASLHLKASLVFLNPITLSTWSVRLRKTTGEKLEWNHTHCNSLYLEKNSITLYSPSDVEWKL